MNGETRPPVADGTGLSLRNNQLKFIETSGGLRIVFKESKEHKINDENLKEISQHGSGWTSMETPGFGGCTVLNMYEYT